MEKEGDGERRIGPVAIAGIVIWDGYLALFRLSRRVVNFFREGGAVCCVAYINKVAVFLRKKFEGQILASYFYFTKKGVKKYSKD